MSNLVQELTPLNQTALHPLCCRYNETQKKHALLHDPLAKKLGEALGCQTVQVGPGMQLNTIAKTLLIDEQIKIFIADHPTATIINLGCGFDTRFSRLTNGKITWYDLDLPELIHVKKKLLPETQRYHYISSNILDASWLKTIKKGNPVLIVAETVFAYLTEKEIRQLFVIIQNTFPHGKLIFDTIAPQVVKTASQHKAFKTKQFSFQWGIADVQTMAEWFANPVEIKQWTIYDGIKKFSKRWNMYHLLYALPHVRNLNKVVAITF